MGNFVSNVPCGGFCVEFVRNCIAVIGAWVRSDEPVAVRVIDSTDCVVLLGTIVQCYVGGPQHVLLRQDLHNLMLALLEAGYGVYGPKASFLFRL